MKKVALSGTQVTGDLHLGNYLGAIINWTKIQDEYNCYFFLADLHSITIDCTPSQLYANTLQTAAIYIAAGLSPDKSAIFAQSMVKEHAELAWLLNCITPLGWLKRMTQFKEKAGKDQDNACLGLFSYPVLQAADILLYQANVVPVGDDQKQHLELTRDIAAAVNRKFDQDILTLPEPLILPTKAKRIMSLKDGRKKMSKSDPSDLSRINLNDSADQVYQKIKKAKTDHLTEISYDHQSRPEISNLIDIFASLSGDGVSKIVDNYQNTGFAKFKNDLSELIILALSPINTEYMKLMQNQDYLISILHSGAEKARIPAAQTLATVKQSFGFVR
jgi:tryptophanyl-tRNA synthetase